MPGTAPDKPDQRNNLWPSIRTLEDARKETSMASAGILIGIVGTFGVAIGHHRSIWHVLSAAISPEGMDPERLVPTLLAGQSAAFVIFAVQLWRGPAVWPAIVAVSILAAEFITRVAFGAGAHMMFLYMAATAYAVTGLRASWFIRRHEGTRRTSQHYGEASHAHRGSS